MSEPNTGQSALPGARFEGIARLRDCGPQGMITLRGDLASRALRGAATAATGAKMPGQRRITHGPEGSLGWMSPDELLILCPAAAVAERLAGLQARLARSHALAVEVSDARAMFAVEGAGAREVLAKLCPVDLAPGRFEPGELRRTRLAQVPAAFWIAPDGGFRLICFRSVAAYVFDALRMAAQPGGEVGVF